MTETVSVSGVGRGRVLGLALGVEAVTVIVVHVLGIVGVTYTVVVRTEMHRPPDSACLLEKLVMSEKSRRTGIADC